MPITEGNLPLGVKYRVKNPDGSISTVRTISIGVDGGEVVIPTVLRGKIVSDEEAIAHFEQTGANFGTFRTAEEAKAFSEWLHNQHAHELGRGRNSATFTPRGVPGERVTSTRRSASRNRAVGGVANSYHLSGRARDSVPPAGMSMNEYYRRLVALNPDKEVINEGDHIHMEPI